ncbi:MAG: ADP-ribosylglycohydrolase family protein [Myxococcota bacterium]
MPGLKERVAGGIWGLLVGDALGVPYEFHSAEEIPAPPLIEMTPPPGFRASHGVPPGTWSDDGAHALCLLASLNHCGRLDIDDLGRRLVNWHDHGYLAVDNRIFDVGIQTAQAIHALREGKPAEHTGPREEMHNGNGSLMRVLPLALWHRGTDEELVHDAHHQSLPTHGHPRSQVCCALYCLWARRLLHDVADPYRAAVAMLRAIYGGAGPHAEELERHVRPDEEHVPRGTGYVVDCLHSARFALREPSYDRVVRAAVALGRDTDTTAAVAGGLAGVRDGVEAIPRRWLDQLRERDTVEPLLEKLLRQWD